MIGLKHRLNKEITYFSNKEFQDIRKNLGSLLEFILLGSEIL